MIWTNVAWTNVTVTVCLLNQVGLVSASVTFQQQQYHGYKLPDFDQTLNLGLWDQHQ